MFGRQSWIGLPTTSFNVKPSMLMYKWRIWAEIKNEGYNHNNYAQKKIRVSYFHFVVAYLIRNLAFPVLHRPQLRYFLFSSILWALPPHWPLRCISYFYLIASLCSILLLILACDASICPYHLRPCLWWMLKFFNLRPPLPLCSLNNW